MLPPRVLIAVLVAVLCLVPAAVASGATATAPTTTPTTPAPAPDPVIATGVTAGGVDVGGLTVPEATERLQQELGPRMAAPVVVIVAGHTFKLRSGPGKFFLNAQATAQRALRDGVATAPTSARSGGATPISTVKPLINHSGPAVRSFAASIASAIYQAPRSARLRIGVTKMRWTKSATGRALNTDSVVRSINRKLDTLGESRVLRSKPVTVKPATNVNDLARQHGTILTVDRPNFKLRLFKHLKLSKTYGIAVGMAGLSTPAGQYAIQNKQVDPVWNVPNSAWAGSLAGQTIPGGAPNNPLKARWMGIVDGVGIHGTSEDWSIGSAASHGCIRMHVSDVIDLYPRVPVGTTVLIH